MTSDNSIELVYQEIRDLISRQESKVDEARGRASSTMGVAALALSFFAGSILERSDPGVGLWVGVAFVAVGIGLSLWVMNPRRRAWTFGSEPSVLLADYARLPQEQSKLALAVHMAGWSERNDVGIERIYSALISSITSVGLGLLVLILEFGGLI